MNLLVETMEDLQANGKSPDDVLWCGSRDIHMDWTTFAANADVDYDSGHGAAEVAQDLLIVGDNWWFERGEYDGSEWWEFKTAPKKGITHVAGRVRLTVRGTKRVGWVKLVELL